MLKHQQNTDVAVLKPKIPTEILVLVAAAFIIALGYGLIAPILPQFVVTFDVSFAAASAVVSIFAGSRLLFAPMSGALIDKLGSRKVYLSGLLIVALTTGLVALAQDYWQILVLRGLAGIGSTMFSVSAMGLIVRMAPAEIRGRCSSVYASAFLIGSVVGPLVGAALSPLGMRIPFVIYGAALALASFVVWLKMPGVVHKTHNTSSQKQSLFRFKDAIRDSAYRSVLISGFANGWSNFGVRVAILPLFATAVFSNGGLAAGLAMAAFATGNAICLQFSGDLSDRLGRKPLIIWGLVINSVFTAVLGFAENIWLLVVLSVVAGIGAGLMNPSQQAVLADIIGSERQGGRLLASYQMAQDFGAIIGPILVGMIAQTFGFHYAFVICGAIGLTAAALWAFGRETLARS